MNRTKKLIALNLAMLMLAAVFPINALAQIVASRYEMRIPPWDDYMMELMVELFTVSQHGTYEFAIHSYDQQGDDNDALRIFRHINGEYDFSGMVSPSQVRQQNSFTRVFAFELEPGEYHLAARSPYGTSSSSVLMLWPHVNESIPLRTTTAVSSNNNFGSVRAWPATAKPDMEVWLLPYPEDGYTFSHWEVTSGNINLNVSDWAQTFIMPNNDVSVRAVFAVQAVSQVSVSVNNSAWGRAFSDVSSAAEGWIVSLEASPNPGYRFVDWEFLTNNVREWNWGGQSGTYFRMPNSDVLVRALFEPIASVTTSVNNTAWGTASANHSNAAQGTSVTLTASPSAGYRFVRWEVISGGATLSNVNSQTATFTMPNNAVSVRAVFEAAAGNAITTSVNNTAWGTASANPSTASQGATVTLTASPGAGYRFIRWEVISGGVTLSNVNSQTATFTMPNSAVSVRAVFEAATGNAITTSVNNTAWGTASSLPSNAAQGATVTLTASPGAGYRFVRWEVLSGGVTLSNVNSQSATFTMPNSAVSVRAVFEAAAGNAVTTSVNNTAWGTASANPSNAVQGTAVSLTASPGAGFRFDRWEVLSGGVTLSNVNSQSATFTMPNNAVSVRAHFILNVDFESASAWALEGLSRAIQSNLVPQSLQSHFTQNTTRAEFAHLAVMLYENKMGTIHGRISFIDTNDVNVEKAAAIGVVNGVGDNKFDPDDTLTREQAATMLARLAVAVGQPLHARQSTFADNEDISYWAFDAVGQVQGAGIMEGIGSNTFAPQDQYTREQSIVTTLRLFDYMS